MAIEFSIEYKNPILRVTAKGFDDDIEDVLNYVNVVVNAALKYQCSLILSDERELEYRITTLDTYQLAEFASSYAKHLAKIAIVCNDKFEADAKFYETVTNNRGLQVKVLKSIKDAENWLLQ